jgi:rRNA-processing protein CGR1
MTESDKQVKGVGTLLSEATLKEVIPVDPGKGKRVGGKNWKVEKKAFRIKSLGVSSSWKKKQEQRLKEAQDKARLKELQAEKQSAHKARIEKIKEKREKKAEEERYEKLATIMHAKRVERLKRREKRNKLLKER